MKKPELSCVIITLNEEKHLPKILESLNKQTFKDFEIIIADFNSTDKTCEIAKSNDCRVTLGGKPSKARNNGAKIARGDFLLFLDADSVLQKKFIEVNFKKFKESGAGVASVHVKPLGGRVDDQILFGMYNLWATSISKKSPHGTGACIFVKKEVFKKVKGFDEKIVLAEDHNFLKRASKFGGFIFLPIPIYTSVRRLEKDGRLKYAGKLIYAGLYRLFHKEIEVDEELFDYI